MTDTRTSKELITAPENPTLEDLIAFYGDGNFRSGVTVRVPYRATQQALTSLQQKLAQAENRESAFRRANELLKMQVDAMEDCIGPRDGQTFEERAEELIVTEVNHENLRRASNEPPAEQAGWTGCSCVCTHGVSMKVSCRECSKESSQPPSPDDARDAALWRALIGCARVRVLGSAGLYRPQANGYAHIGVEFWTRHEFASDPSAIEDLTNFATIARATATKVANDAG